MSYLVLGVIVLFIIWLWSSLIPSKRLREFANRVPGPGSWPVFTNSLLVLGVQSILETLAAACQAYGPVVRIWIGKKLLFILSDPADIEVFLKGPKFLEKSLPYRLFDEWLGTKGLLTSNGEVWHRHRKLLTPSFHFKVLESSVDPAYVNALRLCQHLTNEVDKLEFNIYKYVERCGVDMVCETIMGVSFQNLVLNNAHFYRSIYNSAQMNMSNVTNEEFELEMVNYKYYLNALYKLRTIGTQRFFQPWMHPRWFFRWTISGQYFYKSARAAKTCIRSVILARRELLKKAILEKNQTDNEETEDKPKIFLDYLLKESDFTNEEIEDQVQTFMFGGSVTLPTTIAFCLYAISKHQDVQEKIVQEIETLRGNNPDVKLNYQNYNDMKYLENVIKETLRLYTTVPLIARAVTEDVNLPSGHTLPAGSIAGICLLHMHRNKKFFNHPDRFIPERFEDKNHNRHVYAYIPFSAGPRNCIGQKYAMLVMKIVISTLLQRFRFLPSEKVDSLTLESGFVLMSLENHPVRVTYRT